jgi:exopolysaccharide biosynthesis protein
VLHPRTSIGFNATLKQLVLVVVDGRQKKISEGVSEEELARLMLEFGCSDAINLDGGGSSVMIVRENDGDLRYINRSSDVTGVRPVPVIFGFRAR